eukprot:g1934.t1
MSQQPASVVVPNSAVPGVHGPIYRNARDGPRLSADGCYTLYENFQRAVNKYGTRPAVGFRPIDPSTGEAGDFEWLTYVELWERARNFGSGLVNLGLCKPNEDGIKPLGFFAKNRYEWSIGLQGCNAYTIVPVPMYDTLDVDGVSYVVNQTGLQTMFCTTTVFDVVVGTAKGTQDDGSPSPLKNCILMDADSSNVASYKSKGAAAGITVYSLDEVESSGMKSPQPVTPPSRKDFAFFCYTSGTTGNPKGALLTHENMIVGVAGLDTFVLEYGLIDENAAHLSYLPLPHVFEQLNQAAMTYYGGRIGYYQGDTLKILDDLAALRPTFFPSVPRLLNRIYDKILMGVKEAGGVKQTLFEYALQQKLDGLRHDKGGDGTVKHWLWDRIVFGPLKKRLGLDNLKVMITGSAPISSRVMNFLRAVFGVPVVEGYGQTESAAIATATFPDDLSVGHVGAPAPGNEIALFDVPEMGYLSTDTEHSDGSPCDGRGEICFRGYNVFAGYYKMPEKTRDTVDKDGWLHSGDIGVWTKEGKLRIVDRKKNIFKLSQGEYVAAEKLENFYLQSSLVAQSFVYGDSLQSKLVAIVVPDPEVLGPWAKEKLGKGSGSACTLLDRDSNYESLCNDPQVVAAVLKDMTAVGKKCGFKGFEFARAIYLFPEPFSVDNNLLTPTFKLKRPIAKEYFAKQIKDMYEKLAKGAEVGMSKM